MTKPQRPADWNPDTWSRIRPYVADAAGWDSEDIHPGLCLYDDLEMDDATVLDLLHDLAAEFNIMPSWRQIRSVADLVRYFDEIHHNTEERKDSES